MATPEATLVVKTYHGRVNDGRAERHFASNCGRRAQAPGKSCCRLPQERYGVMRKDTDEMGEVSDPRRRSAGHSGTNRSAARDVRPRRVYPQGPSRSSAPGPTQAPLRSTHRSGRPNNHLARRVGCLYPGGWVVPVSRKPGTQQNSASRSRRRPLLAARPRFVCVTGGAYRKSRGGCQEEIRRPSLSCGGGRDNEGGV